MKAVYRSPVTSSRFPSKGTLQEQIMFCCQYGALAPSVHNLQPWAIEIKGDLLKISIYTRHNAQDSDATGRQTWISIGCFAENVLQAAQASGMRADVAKEDYTKNTITIKFELNKQTPVDAQPLSNMSSRVTSRALFDPIELQAGQLQKLKDAQKGLPGAQLAIKSDRAIIDLMTELTKQAVGLALSMPRLKKELGQTFRSNISKRKTGIPGYALGYGLLRSIIEPLRFTHLRVAPGEAAKESERMQHSAGFVFITTSGDIAKYWFQAGRLYERAALLLAEFGVDQSTNAATVEAPDFHQEIEKQIGTTNRLQAVIRYGKSKKKASPSPRLAVDEIFTSNALRD